MQIFPIAHRAYLAEKRVIEREMRVPGVVKDRLDAMAYLDLMVDVHQRLAERCLARACRFGPKGVGMRRHASCQPQSAALEFQTWKTQATAGVARSSFQSKRWKIWRDSPTCLRSTGASL
jgi:hypothetical protein